MNKWFRKDLQPNKVLQEIFSTEEVQGPMGQGHKFIDGVDPLEGMHLYNCVKQNKFQLTLEVGLAMGTPAVYIFKRCKIGHAKPTPSFKSWGEKKTHKKLVHRMNLCEPQRDMGLCFPWTRNAAKLPHYLSTQVPARPNSCLDPLTKPGMPLPFPARFAASS
jgi:hypothetical protein